MEQLMETQIIETYQSYSQNCFNCGKQTKNLLGYCKIKCQTEHVKKYRTNTYLNREMRDYISQLTELFCLDHTPVVQLKPNWNSNQHGVCHWRETPIRIEIGCKEGVSLQVLVHEFIHAMGYDHEWEINGFSNFRSQTGLDTFSGLIVKDLVGKKELII